MGTSIEIKIDNLKCGGCETSILKGLGAISGISDVVVNHEYQTVRFTGEESLRQIVADKLRTMGYPEKDTLHGIQAGIANAKSFVSCAIGRI